jgi:Icc protein
MRIIQISDLHLTEKGLARTVDVNANFIKILDDLSTYKPDLVILTGDICFDYGNVTVYEKVKMELDSRNIKYLIIPGNHDDSELMTTVFNTSFNFAIELKKHLILTCNSGKGIVSKSELQWLENQISFTNLIPVLFIHYPVIDGHVGFMENKYPLQNRTDIQNMLNVTEKSFVFCGHYHCDNYSNEKGIHQFIAPSPFFQIQPDKQKFEIENHLIGYRIIDFDESISTRVRYC